MNLQNLDLFQTNPQDVQERKVKEIVASKEAKGHFFQFDYLEKYREAVNKNEDLKTQQYEALDSIDYYNKKYLTKDKLQQMAKIRGSFLKVRS